MRCMRCTYVAIWLSVAMLWFPLMQCKNAAKWNDLTGNHHIFV